MSTTSDLDLEKGAGVSLEKVGTIVLTPEMFEKLYLSPQNTVKGDLRSTFGNPTPLALIGFLLSLTPLACGMIGWMGAAGNGAASIGIFISCGALLMILGGILEFFLGNTFPFVIFCSMGSLFLSLATTNIPSFGVMNAFKTAEYASGDQNPQFYNTFAFYIMFVGIMDFMYLIASVRTNIVFMAILTTTTLGLELLAGSYWAIGAGNMERALTLQHASGWSCLATTMLAWYLFFVLVLAAVDFPYTLPVGDLSTVIKGRSQKLAATVARNGRD